MVPITELPDVVIDKIMSFFTYHEIANNRIVSRWFNKIGWRTLNTGYFAIEQGHKRKLKEIKAKLPRRESERRNHPLARKCDILISIDTRLSMLSMTYRRFVDAHLCCFIPGKVLDELFNLLKYLDSADDLSRTDDVLQELRDISTMAIEYFDENIAPQLRRLFALQQAENIIRNSGLACMLSKVQVSECDSLNGIPHHTSQEHHPVTMHYTAIDNIDGALTTADIAAVVDETFTGDSVVNGLIVEMFAKITRCEIQKREEACKKSTNALKSLVVMLFNQLKDKTRDVGLLADNLNLQAKLLLNHEAIIKSLKKRLAQYHRRCISTEKRLEDLKKEHLMWKTELRACKRSRKENANFFDESPLKKLKREDVV